MKIPANVVWARAISLCALMIVASPLLAAPNDALCWHGEGSFRGTVLSSVEVSVGPQESVGHMHVRRCMAQIRYGSHILPVAINAAAVELDALGVDLNADGQHTAAFWVRQTDEDCCGDYLIYALERPAPKLLFTIHGPDSFSAADTDLDGRIEIWARDSQALAGIDGLTSAELRPVAPHVLRLDHGHLQDVGVEFQPAFDAMIAEARASLDASSLQQFKAVANSGSEVALRSLKAVVLRIVMAYLHSGRDEQAWRALDEFWPQADVARVRALISEAEKHGLAEQVDERETAVPILRRKPPHIFEEQDVTPARAIHIFGPSLGAGPVSSAKMEVWLVIDSAGKVRDVERVNATDNRSLTPLLDLKLWTFVPAFQGWKPVASRLLLSTWMER